MTEQQKRQLPEEREPEQVDDERGQRLAGGAPEEDPEETTRDESSQTFANKIGRRTGGGSG